MAARKSHVYMRNLVVVTGYLSEGALTRADAEDPAGGTIEGSITRAAPVKKGDLVTLVAASTTKGDMVFAKAPVGNEENFVHGVVVSSPEGIDDVTVSGQEPAHAQRRKCSVALFGTAVIELESNGTIEPACAVGISESEANIVGKLAAAPTENGGWVALSYAVDGEKIPILIGFSGFVPAD